MHGTGARVKERACARPSASRRESSRLRVLLLLAAVTAILRTHGPSLSFLHGPLPLTWRASAEPKVRLAAKKRSGRSKISAPSPDTPKVGSLVRGVVKPTKAYQGCFMDIGTETWARLDIPKNISMLEKSGKLRSGTTYQVRISNVNPSNGHVNLQFEDHDAMLSKWQAERKPIASYKAGDSVKGVVAASVAKGKVLLDIGCTHLARLTASPQVKSLVRMSEEFENLIVESADLAKGKIKVALPEDIAKEIASRRQPRSDPKDEASSSAPELVPVLKRSKSMGGNNFTLSVVAGANSQQRLRLSLEGFHISGVDTSRNRLRVSVMPETFANWKESPDFQYTDLRVGDCVDGRVRNVNKFGTFIRVEGCATPLKLNASEEIQARLRFGEELRDLRITEVHDKGAFVKLPDQTLAEIASRTDDKLSLEKAEVGSIVHGHVAMVSRIGAFIDVGYEVPAIVMDWKKTKFVPGQLLRGLRISKVDLEKRRLQVRL